MATHVCPSASSPVRQTSTLTRPSTFPPSTPPPFPSHTHLQARGYKNEALAALFVMNNVHYIQWSVESSPAALELMGVAWLERHKDMVEEWGAAYHDATWMPLVNMLRVRSPHVGGGGEGPPGGVSTFGRG